MKKYYIEVDDDGIELKRKLTTFNELEDLKTFAKDELAQLMYEASAEVLSKVIKFREIEGVMLEKYGMHTMDDVAETLEDVNNNLVEAWERIGGYKE